MATVILGITWACNVENEVMPPINLEDQLEQEGLTKVVLGIKLENPYTVENMQLAYDNLLKEAKSGRIESEDLDIRTTHLYLRFLPKDSSELELLEKDTTLWTYPYPLDYEIDSIGDYFIDETVGEFPPQYTAVPVDFQLPSIRYELLANLYLPETDTVDESNGRTNTNYFLDELEDEALRITDNWEEPISTPNGRCRRRCWTPSGRILVNEDYGNRTNAASWVRTVPVVGAEVKARRWFKVSKRYTDRNGEFVMFDRFRRPVRYSVHFKRHRFTVKDGWWGNNAEVRSNGKRREAWNIRIVGGRDLFNAWVFNAAYDYYFRWYLNYTIKMPPYGNILAKYNKEGSNFRVHRFWGTVRVSRFTSNGDYRWSDGVYATTIHELTHRAHYKIQRGGGLWGGCKDDELCEHKMMTESWAEGVETILTNRRYNDLDPNYNDEWNSQRQTHDLVDMTNYTPIVIDLVDDENQRRNDANNPIDRVDGYRLNQIQEALRDSDNLREWRDNLDSKYWNRTEEFLDEYFQQYIDLL